MRRAWWTAVSVRPEVRAATGAQSLDLLRESDTFSSVRSYLPVVSALAEGIELLNDIQSEIDFSVEFGARVRGLSYDDSGELTRYAESDSLLAGLIEAALDEPVGSADLVLLSATSPEELLTAMIAARLIKKTTPSTHVCLADHWYENFSLDPHLPRLRSRNTLTRVFDSVLTSRERRDLDIRLLASAVGRGAGPSGFPTTEDLRRAAGPRFPERTKHADASAFATLADGGVFAPEPVLSLRLSEGPCYWSRCTFCVQNLKYEGCAPPAADQAVSAVERIESAVAAGYRTFILMDEALPPAFLSQFSRRLRERSLPVRWGCRAKLEPAFGHELFGAMRDAGCYEVIMGLESISPATLERMGKCTPGVDPARTRRIIAAAAEVGLSLHLNLIAGFPDESTTELLDSVEFVTTALEGIPRGTFTLNPFALFPGSAIAGEPATYGLRVLPPAGDMPMRLAYEPMRNGDSHACALTLVPALERYMHRQLGWDQLGSGPGPDLARYLYFTSGHGALFKANTTAGLGWPAEERRKVNA